VSAPGSPTPPHARARPNGRATRRLALAGGENGQTERRPRQRPRQRVVRRHRRDRGRRARARPLAVPTPMRSPVNEPGPIETRGFKVGRGASRVGEQPVDHDQDPLRMCGADVERATRDPADRRQRVRRRRPASTFERQDLHGTGQCNAFSVIDKTGATRYASGHCWRTQPGRGHGAVAVCAVVLGLGLLVAGAANAASVVSSITVGGRTSTLSSSRSGVGTASATS